MGNSHWELSSHLIEVKRRVRYLGELPVIPLAVIRPVDSERLLLKS
jgi:hypothetical protein